MTPAQLAYYSMIVLAISVVAMFLIFGLAQGYYRLIAKTTPSEKLEGTPFFYFLTAISFVAAFSVLILFGSGLWQLFITIKSLFTPLRLAAVSIFIGIFPLFISMLGSLIAKTLGCSLNEAGVSECKWRGRDVGPMLYTMFMFGWLSMFTMGFTVLGLIASAIWAITS